MPGILDDSGRIHPAVVVDVTEGNIDTIMKLAGVAAVTSKDELWGVCQDFQRQVASAAEYKAALSDDNALASTRVDPAQVATANSLGRRAAGSTCATASPTRRA